MGWVTRKNILMEEIGQWLCHNVELVKSERITKLIRHLKIGDAVEIEEIHEDYLTDWEILDKD